MIEPSDPISAAERQILAINGGSSSIKFALFAVAGDGSGEQCRVLGGQIERVGQPGTTLVMAGAGGQKAERRSVVAANHAQAAERLIEQLRQPLAAGSLLGIGHRIVHGGVRLIEHQRITDDVLAELKRTVPLDPAHLPREIALVEALTRLLPAAPQVACFDTAFHRELPQVAKLLPIPRHYFDAG